jgi:hypothetical protein
LQHVAAGFSLRPHRLKTCATKKFPQQLEKIPISKAILQKFGFR